MQSSLFTYRREHLVFLGRHVVRYIDPVFLMNPYEPVVVAIDGSYGSGKTIIADFGTAELFGEKGGTAHRLAAFGRLEGTHTSGIDIEVTFLDMNVFRPHLPDYIEGLDEAALQRTKGGVFFVHNLEDSERFNPWLKMHVLKPEGEQGWQRVVSRKLFSKRLEASQRFMQGWHSWPSFSRGDLGDHPYP